jgi:hypothetical protein
MLTLTSLAQLHGTDKASHGFTFLYDNKFQHLRKCARKVLEVGVFFGSSLKMWKDYFSSADCVIYGLDHFIGEQGNGHHFDGFMDYYNAMEKSPDPRIRLFKVNQSRKSELEHFVHSQARGTFDIIVDDGSHLMYDQQLTLGVLWALVRPGGYYVIEDVHSSEQNGYDVNAARSNTTLKMLNEFQKSKSLTSEYLNPEVLQNISHEVDYIEIYHVKPGSMTSILKKKCQSIPINPYQRKGTVLVNYSSGEPWVSMQAKNAAWAKQWGVNDVLCMSRTDIDEDYLQTHSSVLFSSRGNGYWAWKPYIILAAMIGTNADYVIYCDSSSNVNDSLQACQTHAQPIGVYTLGYEEREYTKRDTFQVMDVEAQEHFTSNQIAATFIVFKVNTSSINFVQQWLVYSQNRQLISDDPSITGIEHPTFKEHRHDQSILSLLCKKTGLVRTKSFQGVVNHHIFG